MKSRRLVGVADWKESPEEVLASVARQVKPFGLVVRFLSPEGRLSVRNPGGSDTVAWVIVAIASR